VVARSPRRLLGRTHRAELARSLDTLCEQAQRQVAPPQCSRPLYRPSVLIAVAPELHAIARLVERGGAGPAGVAMTERLLNAHDSPLYGPDAALLREQLRRIAFALNSGDTRLARPSGRAAYRPHRPGNGPMSNSFRCRLGKHAWTCRGRGDALNYVCLVCGKTRDEPAPAGLGRHPKRPYRPAGAATSAVDEGRGSRLSEYRSRPLHIENRRRSVTTTPGPPERRPPWPRQAQT
jgi:hypothetical protein